MLDNPFQFAFDNKYESLRDFACQLERNLNLTCYKGRGLSNEDLYRFVCLHEQIHKIADHSIKGFALLSADKAAGVLSEDPILAPFVFFAQNQDCFELQIQSDGFLLFLHFIQANIQPVFDKKILYTAGVPESVITSNTRKTSAQLTDYITEQYSQFNHRLNFVMAKNSMSDIFRICGYSEIPSTNTIEELSTVFNQLYNKTREPEISSQFSSINVKKIHLFLTACQGIFTYTKKPADYQSKIMMCEALRIRFNGVTITPESRSSAASCSSALFSQPGASGSQDPIHANATPLMAIKHKMICAFEIRITHLEKKAFSRWHMKNTCTLAANKASLLKDLKSAIYLADSEETCKTILGEVLKNPLIDNEKNSTTTRVIIDFYETFPSEVSSASDTPALRT